MADSRPCPRCGAPLGDDAPSGLCPKCLVQAGFESANSGGPSVAATAASPSLAFVPPTVEEMARRFPQLEILELLGKGGMGAVYKARQPGLDRLVAVKILPPQVGADPSFAERFQREARLLAKLNHPNIVGVHDFGKADGLYYFIMEYIHGANLRQTMRAGELTAMQALAIVPQICDALQYAHDEGVVHRDIKPENILLDTKGRVKIADFGLSKLMGEERPDAGLTGTHEVMGTLRYMAPEQLQGTKTVDHRADIFSLGVVFYELLTGEIPMGRFEPPSQRVQIDVRLDEVVLRTLEQEPSKRYQRAGDVKTDVETVRRSPAGVASANAPPHATDVASDDFTIQVYPRDSFDLTLFFAVMMPWIAGMFMILPGLAVLIISSGLGMEFSRALGIGVVSGMMVMIGFCIVLSIGSVYSLRVDAEGMTIHPLLGPSKFLPWAEIRRVEPLTWWETVRHVWLWPGLPARGSILSMTAADFFRIDCRGDCWYFAPPRVGAFFDAIARVQPRVLPPEAAKPAADDPLREAREMTALPAVFLATMGSIHFYSGLLLLVIGSFLPGFWSLPVVFGFSWPMGVWFLIALAMGALMFEGARRMADLSAYPVAVAAAGLTAIPYGALVWFHPLFWLAYFPLLLGVWAIAVLLRPDVREAFYGIVPPKPATPPSSALSGVEPEGPPDPSGFVCAIIAIVVFSLGLLVPAILLAFVQREQFPPLVILFEISMALALLFGLLGRQFALGRYAMRGALAVLALSFAGVFIYWISSSSADVPAKIPLVGPGPSGVAPSNAHAIVGRWTESNDAALEPVHRLHFLANGEWHESGPLTLSIADGPPMTLSEDLNNDGKKEILPFHATGSWTVERDEILMETSKTNLTDSQFSSRRFTIVEANSERLVLRLMEQEASQKPPLTFTMFRDQSMERVVTPQPSDPPATEVRAGSDEAQRLVLDHWVGEWVIDRGMGQETKVRGRWILDHRFLELSILSPDGSEVLVIETYNPQRKKFVAWQFEAEPSGWSQGEGLWDATTKTLTYELTNSRAPGKLRFSTQFAVDDKLMLTTQQGNGPLVSFGSGRRMQPGESFAAAKAVAASNPRGAPEMARLSDFIGEWNGEIKDQLAAEPKWTPAGSGKKAWTLGGFFVRDESYTPTGELGMLGLWTYDETSKEYREWYFFATGAWQEERVKWDEPGKVFQITGTMNTGMTFAGTRRLSSPTTYLWESIGKDPSGKTVLDMHGRMTRK